MAGPSTAGYAALAEGEDWHYVGATDEPAFNSTWANISTLPKLAFRRREAGIVDIQGTVTGGSTGVAIFTLPDGYRPSVKTYVPGTAHTLTPANEGCYVVIDSSGTVTPSFTLASPQLYIYCQVFLVTPAVA